MKFKRHIDLGCGYRKPIDMIGLDNRLCCNPDIVCNLEEGIPFKDSSIEYVRAFDILEHIPIGKTIFVMEEIYRVLMPNGMLEAFIPSTDGRLAFCDPYHVSFWNILSFRYYTDDAHRNLYGIKAKFEVHTLRNQLLDPVNKGMYVYAYLKAVK